MTSVRSQESGSCFVAKIKAPLWREDDCLSSGGTYLENVQSPKNEISEAVKLQLHGWFCVVRQLDRSLHGSEVVTPAKSQQTD